MKSDTDFVNESYNRAIDNDVMGRFYEIFLDSHPDIAPYFSKTDFAEQKKLLKQGVLLAIMLVEGYPHGYSGIKRIRKSHGKAGFNIPPELYSYWKESFLQAISEQDPECCEQTRNAWDSVIQQTIDYITSNHEPD